MAGKKGMHRRRPMNNKDKDEKALSQIEHIIDSIATGTILCSECGKEHVMPELAQAHVRLLTARYDKLRPTLSAVEHSGRVDTYTNLLQSLPAEFQNTPGSTLVTKPDTLQ